uniref:Calnexin n=1 Tax=Schistosoma japonicum TaxID=6182 RepID=C1LK10_SCHJA|nr:calnexin [Schistosoma japonicum]
MFVWRCLVVCLSFGLWICTANNPELEPEVGKKKPSFVTPDVPNRAYLALFFNAPSDITQKLIVSEARKDGIDNSIAKYDGVWSVEVPYTSAIGDDYALVLKSKAKHHAVSTRLSRPIKFDTDELVIQYDVKFQDGIDCGGAYIKLLSASPNLDLKQFNDKTPYTIMFGPDKCGLENKFHFIFRYKNPNTGVYEEKHAKKVVPELESYFSDKKTHLYTLVLRSDNSFERYIDQIKVQSGNLLDDFDPPVNPPKEIDDPHDKKPSDWDEREKIVDINAKKPDDWDEDAPATIEDENAVKPSGWLDDEPEMIPDPSAEPPKDWDREMDGEWVAPKINNPKCANAPGCGEWHRPLVPNPKYKGKWSAPMIPNPNFKGIWAPKKIPNPNYFEEKNPFKSLSEVSALGLELWSMANEISFDNFLIVDSKRAADEFAQQTWAVKKEAERLADPKAQSVVDAIRETYNEKPWLIVVVGLVCTLPILLCCIYFCRSPSKHRDISMHKKTDTFTPDDSHSHFNEKNAENEELEESGEDDIVQVSKGSGDESLANKSGSSRDNSEEEAPNEFEGNENVPAAKQSTRKRRSRKE